MSSNRNRPRDTAVVWATRARPLFALAADGGLGAPEFRSRAAPCYGGTQPAVGVQPVRGGRGRIRRSGWRRCGCRRADRRAKGSGSPGCRHPIRAAVGAGTALAEDAGAVQVQSLPQRPPLATSVAPSTHASSQQWKVIVLAQAPLQQVDSLGGIAGRCRHRGSVRRRSRRGRCGPANRLRPHARRGQRRRQRLAGQPPGDRPEDSPPRTRPRHRLREVI